MPEICLDMLSLAQLIDDLLIEDLRSIKPTTPPDQMRREIVNALGKAGIRRASSVDGSLVH
jgi:hypothetical protein